MSKIDLKALRRKKTLFKTTGKPVITSAAERTHRVSGVCLGVYWYHVPSGKILWSGAHGAFHLDPDFLRLDAELFRLINDPLPQEASRKVMDAHPKEHAYRAGWISGRVGSYDGKIFAFIYRNKIYSDKLTGVDGVALINKIGEVALVEVEFLLDHEGFNLARQIPVNTKTNRRIQR